MAADLGVSTDTIAETVRVGTIGDIGMNLAKFNATDRQIPIRVLLPESLRGHLSEIGAMKVPVKRGQAVPLETVADISLGQGPTAIDRYDRAIRVAIEGDMQGSDALGELISQVMKLPAASCVCASTSCARQAGLILAMPGLPATASRQGLAGSTPRGLRSSTSRMAALAAAAGTALGRAGAAGGGPASDRGGL